MLDQIDTIVEIQLPRDPVITILNLWQSFALDPLRRELVELLLHAARSLIAQHWKSVKIPMLSEWFLKVWDFFLQDKVSISILRADNYPIPTNLQEKWLPLLSDVSSKKVDDTLFSHHEHHDLLSYF